MWTGEKECHRGTRCAPGHSSGWPVGCPRQAQEMPQDCPLGIVMPNESVHVVGVLPGNVASLHLKQAQSGC